MNTHTCTRLDWKERGEDKSHFADGWCGSRTTHHFSISISSHSALSLYLPASINLYAARLCFPSAVSRAIRPYLLKDKKKKNLSCFVSDALCRNSSMLLLLLHLLLLSVYFSGFLLVFFNWRDTGDTSRTNQMQNAEAHRSPHASSFRSSLWLSEWFLPPFMEPLSP